MGGWLRANDLAITHRPGGQTELGEAICLREKLRLLAHLLRQLANLLVRQPLNLHPPLHVVLLHYEIGHGGVPGAVAGQQYHPEPAVSVLVHVQL